MHVTHLKGLAIAISITGCAIEESISVCSDLSSSFWIGKTLIRPCSRRGGRGIVSLLCGVGTYCLRLSSWGIFSQARRMKSTRKGTVIRWIILSGRDRVRSLSYHLGRIWDW